MDLDRPQTPNPYDYLPQAPALEVSSPDFGDGQPLPESAGYADGNTSPALAWSAVEGASSYLMTCHDPDAPVVGGFWHWAVALPGSTTSVPSGAGSKGGSLPEGAITLRNGYGSTDFGGAAPPEGDRPHRYIFAVTALDTAEHGLDADTSLAKAQFSTMGNVLARGTVTGTYSL